MTVTVVKKDERDLAEFLSTEWGFVSGLLQYNDQPLVLEHFQLAFLKNRTDFRWVTKGRQVGFSFLFALEALARCHLRKDHKAIFISYAQDEAKEKILLARQFHEELPLAYQKRITGDSAKHITFESNCPKKYKSRIVSNPSKAPRGKNGDVYLDELAHYADDREVYSGTTALIARTHGQLTGASTPLGKRGIFWEIASEEYRRYPRYTRMVVPWWLCSFFCNDIREASIEARQMTTEDRVEKYGRESVLVQFESLPFDDFQQEFEAKFVDQSYSYFPYELIIPNTPKFHKMCYEFSDVPYPTGRLVAGFDVGRTRDKSELAIFEEKKGGFVARLFRSYNQVPFADQEADLRQMLDVLPIARLSIDRSGIGMHMAENLERDYPQVQGENFTSESKERWATNMKILLQRRDIVLPRDRDLVGQIHSIKRRVLPSGKVAYEGERTGNGHADRFWAVAMACQKEKASGKVRVAEIGVRVI